MDHTLFQIKNNNQLCLADGVLPTLDRETDDEYNVVVVVSDRGYPVGDPLTSFITVRHIYVQGSLLNEEALASNNSVLHTNIYYHI